MNNIQIISDKEYLLGENPLWNFEEKELWWTDVFSKCVYSYDPKSNKIKERVKGKSVSSFAFIKNGGLICGCLEGLYLWNKDDGFQKIKDNFNSEILIINDGIADAKGRFLFGTNYYDEKNMNYKLGKLYLHDINGEISVLDEGIHLSNGLGFSTDNSILYYADSVARTIFRYKYDLKTGKVSNKGIFVKVPETEGIPDGLTVDSDDFVWSAQWYGECIIRYDPHGNIRNKIQIPAKQVSSLTFGGDDMTDIYITTAGDNWKSPVAPAGYDYNADNIGGNLYKYSSGFKGRIENYALIYYDK